MNTNPEEKLNNEVEEKTLNQVEESNVTPDLPITKEESKAPDQIEIPQKYYDNLAKEEQAKKEAEEQSIVEEQNRQAASAQNNKTLILALINAVIIGITFIGTVNINHYLFFLGVLIIPVLSIILALKDKSENIYPVTAFLGGIFSGGILYVYYAAIMKNNEFSLYYAICCFALGLVGYIFANIVNRLINKKDEVKAMEKLIMLAFIALIIGGPIFVYKKYPTEVNRYFFRYQTVVTAATENEFLEKTLEQRYDKKFTCDDSSKKIRQEQTTHELYKTRKCNDSDGVEFRGTVIKYQLDQYTVIDDYINTIYLDKEKERLAESIKDITGADQVEVYFYPDKVCTFVGDCFQTKEYLEDLKTINERNYRYDTSVKLNLKKYMNEDSKYFVNDFGFKIIVVIKHRFTNEKIEIPADQTSHYVDSALEVLNKEGYKNNKGFLIQVFNQFTDSRGDRILDKLLEVEGKKASDGTFEEYEVVK